MPMKLMFGKQAISEIVSEESSLGLAIVECFIVALVATMALLVFWRRRSRLFQEQVELGNLHNWDIELGVETYR